MECQTAEGKYPELQEFLKTDYDGETKKIIKNYFLQYTSKFAKILFINLIR